MIKTISPYLLVTVFIAAASAGIALLITQSRNGSSGVEILLPTATPAPELKVYISGAVARTDVYIMKEGDRLADAIAKAGGITLGAQMDCVNLAVKVKDEAQYHVPGTGEDCQAGDTAAQGQSPIEDGLLNLNTASTEQMESLPGIGPVRARAIVDHRETVGPFRSTEEIMDVHGIGQGIYEGIRDLVSLGKDSP